MYFRLEVSLEKPLTQSRDISLCTNNTWHLVKHVIDTYQQLIPCSRALAENLSITHPFSKFTLFNRIFRFITMFTTAF